MPLSGRAVRFPIDRQFKPIGKRTFLKSISYRISSSNPVCLGRINGIHSGNAGRRIEVRWKSFNLDLRLKKKSPLLWPGASGPQANTLPANFHITIGSIMKWSMGVLPKREDENSRGLCPCCERPQRAIRTI